MPIETSEEPGASTGWERLEARPLGLWQLLCRRANEEHQYQIKTDKESWVLEEGGIVPRNPEPVLVISMVTKGPCC